MRKICILLFLAEAKIKERIVILMKEKLEAISKMSKEKIAEIKDSQALNDFKVKVLGKKVNLQRF